MNVNSFTHIFNNWLLSKTLKINQQNTRLLYPSKKTWVTNSLCKLCTFYTVTTFHGCFRQHFRRVIHRKSPLIFPRATFQVSNYVFYYPPPSHAMTNAVVDSFVQHLCRVTYLLPTLEMAHYMWKAWNNFLNNLESLLYYLLCIVDESSAILKGWTGCESFLIIFFLYNFIPTIIWLPSLIFSF